MVKQYESPENLVTRMQTLGLVIGDAVTAQEALKKYGYHRLGGYRYVFRELLPTEHQDPQSRQFRSDTYIKGSSLEDVVKLADFDTKLREVILSGLLDFEVRLRVAIVETLGVRDPLAHLNSSFLNPVECSKTLQSDPSLTKFTAWLETVTKTTRKGLRDHDDFVHHHTTKYSQDPLPIWACLELQSFGSLPNLFELMLPIDQRAVGEQFGITHVGTFKTTLRRLVHLRNLCAHGSRVFNRNLKMSAPVQNDHLRAPLGTSECMTHIETLPAIAASKLYPLVSLLSYMLLSHSSGSKWYNTFKTQVKKLEKINFPDAAKQTPEDNMGFPTNWIALPIWNGSLT